MKLIRQDGELLVLGKNQAMRLMLEKFKPVCDEPKPVLREGYLVPAR